MQARFSCSAHRRLRRAGHTLRDFNDNHQYDQNGNLLWQQPVGGVSTGLLECEAATHYYWLPTPQGDILVGFDQGINSYAVYTDHLGTPRLVTKIDNSQSPKPITDTSNDLPPADYNQPEGISPLAIPVWQWSYSPFGADLANGYEARPTTMANNFKPDLWAWMGLPETGGADANQVAQEAWRVQANLHIPPVLNIRYPGQYYDFEAGLVQNWWRTYEPRIGRYVSADPIGLEGGWNRFAYVAGDGINLSDRMGLDTYMCTQPLHALGDKLGNALYPQSKWNPSLAYHQFLCVKDASGKTACGGQDRSGSAVWSDGKPSNDSWPTSGSGSCKREDDRSCVDQCVIQKIASPKRPKYGIGPQATDCQEWADDALESCQKTCKGKK